MRASSDVRAADASRFPGMNKKLRFPRLIPPWMGTPLVFLGLALAVLYPFGHNWVLYALLLAVTLVDAWHLRATTRTTVTKESDTVTVVRVERRSLFDKYPTHPADEWRGGPDERT
jgi:hypothetical protein